MIINKPFATACARNQQVILDKLKSIIKPTDKKLLEIGSGTGQHAIFMAPYFPFMQWQTADVLDNHDDIRVWVDEAKLANVLSPIEFEIGKTNFPSIDYDIVYTANTLHIMSWQNVELLIQQFGKHLKNGTSIIIYGPFNYKGKFTSDSNANFDVWLKKQESNQGIRNFEAVVKLMNDVKISLQQDIKMPANNRILHFIKNEN